MKETLSETIIENTTNHDEKIKAKLKVSQLENELKTVALEWKSSRNIEECGCSTTFDAFNKKVYLTKLTQLKSFVVCICDDFILASLLVLRRRIMHKMHGGTHETTWTFITTRCTYM